jgi:hypothetical protein
MRLEVYMTIPPTPMMMDLIIKIMVELFSVLALATKEIKRGRFSEYTIRYSIRYSCSVCHREVFEDVVGERQDT